MELVVRLSATGDSSVLGYRYIKCRVIYYSKTVNNLMEGIKKPRFTLASFGGVLTTTYGKYFTG